MKADSHENLIEEVNQNSGVNIQMKSNIIQEFMKTCPMLSTLKRTACTVPAALSGVAVASTHFVKLSLTVRM